MKRAFSLIELSMVLVILGLITGGILAGQSLIRASELRSVAVEYDKWTGATHSFFDEYAALPGDMTTATTFWGAAHATPATCWTTSSSTTATCNGNGDGNIHSLDGGTTYSEWWHYWKQLANAGLIEGSYTGVTGGGSSANSVPGTNVPKSKLSGAGWTIRWLGQYSAGSWFSADYGNLYTYGAAVSNSYTHGAIMKPEEVWNIDVKMDDGKPAQGNVSVFPNTVCTPAVTTADITVDYALTTTSTSCAIIFRRVF